MPFLKLTLTSFNLSNPQRFHSAIASKLESTPPSTINALLANQTKLEYLVTTDNSGLNFDIYIGQLPTYLQNSWNIQTLKLRLESTPLWRANFNTYNIGKFLQPLKKSNLQELSKEWKELLHPHIKEITQKYIEKRFIEINMAIKGIEQKSIVSSTAKRDELKNDALSLKAQIDSVNQNIKSLFRHLRQTQQPPNEISESNAFALKNLAEKISTIAKQTRSKILAYQA